MLPGSNVSRLMARAGYEWVCVDMEHGNIDGMIHIFYIYCLKSLLLSKCFAKMGVSPPFFLNL